MSALPDEFERSRKISRSCQVARAKPDGEEGPGDGFAGVGARCCSAREGDEADTLQPMAPSSFSSVSW